MLSANYRLTRAPPKRLRQTAESENLTTARPSPISLRRRARNRPDGHERDRPVTLKKQNPRSVASVRRLTPWGFSAWGFPPPGDFPQALDPLRQCSRRLQRSRLRARDHPASPPSTKRFGASPSMPTVVHDANERERVKASRRTASSAMGRWREVCDVARGSRPRRCA